MKFISIVIFILCLHVSVALVNASGIFPNYMLPHEEWWGNIDEQRLKEETYVQGNVEPDLDMGLWDFVKGVFYFVYSFGFGIIVFPYTLAMLGLQSPFIYYLSIPVYLLYLLGWFQILANRQTKSMR